MSVKRTAAMIAGLMLMASALVGQQTPNHIAFDTSLARVVTSWVMDWDSTKSRGLCVATHHEMRDTVFVWVQDSVVGQTDKVCPDGQGVIVPLAREWVHAGPEATVPLMAQVAKRMGLPWLCGVAGLKPMQIGGRTIIVPMEWCAYEQPAPKPFHPAART